MRNPYAQNTAPIDWPWFVWMIWGSWCSDCKVRYRSRYSYLMHLSKKHNSPNFVGLAKMLRALDFAMGGIVFATGLIVLLIALKLR